MIGILSYGLGNIFALSNVLDEMNINNKLISDPKNIDNNIKKIILPGVGSFDQTMYLLNKQNFVRPIKKFVENSENKLLGICVGMQVLGRASEEGNEKGLDLIPGKIMKLNAKILPHVGWNKISIKRTNDLLSKLESESKFYFLHSYVFNTQNNYAIADTYYSEKFSSIVSYKNIYGVQFHQRKVMKMVDIIKELFKY